MPFAPLLEEESLTGLNTAAIARNRFNTFLHGSGGTTIGVEYANIRSIVMDGYFRTKPPFAFAKDKKHEFPDAIALSSIEEWAKINGKWVLAVSKDTGWKAFADTSEYIVVAPELSEALALLQQDPEHVHDLVGDLLKRIQEDRDSPLAVMFRNYLTAALQDQAFYGEGASDFAAVAFDDVEVKMMDFNLGCVIK